MAKYITPSQPLILSTGGQKPTIPEPSTIMPTDNRFDIQSDLMIGQLAYNVVDDIWYYRAGASIKQLSGSTVLEVEDVEVWRDDKAYPAGNTFVSYINTDSTDEQFQTAAIYRCVTDTDAGESPESDPNKWELQGTSVDNSNINFLDLEDTPTSYDGLAGKFVAINDEEDGLKFVDPPESETITLDTVEVWDETKDYTAGNTFVSYVNTESSDEQFQDEAIYRCDVDTTAGESPESHPDKWIYQGTSVEVSSSNTSNTTVADLATLKAITGYKNTDSLFVVSEKAWYKFDSNDDTGTKANDYDATDNPGSWKPFTLLTDLIEEGETTYWELETTSAATTEHPRWDDSGDAEVYGRDEFGFNALPAGRRTNDGTYFLISKYSYFWSSTESNTTTAREINLVNQNSFVSRNSQNKESGFSIRLIRPYTTSDGDKIDGRIISNAFTDADGNNYDGVIIGDQVWLTSNLKTTSYTNGDPITTDLNDTDWSNITDGAYAVYDYNEVSGIDSEAEMIEAYGLLYNWYAVDDSRGLGDADWHVPSDNEFTELTDYLIATYPDITEDNIGDYLKSVRQVNSPFEVESDEVLRPKKNLEGDRRKILEEDINLSVTAGFSFSGIESFKHVFGKDIEFESVEKASDITDLRVGINGSTPETISFPLTISASDVVKFEATYDRESDSYFTLIGKQS